MRTDLIAVEQRDEDPGALSHRSLARLTTRELDVLALIFKKLDIDNSEDVSRRVMAALIYLNAPPPPAYAVFHGRTTHGDEPGGVQWAGVCSGAERSELAVRAV